MASATTDEAKESFEYYFKKAATYLDVGISEMPVERAELRNELKVQVDKFLHIVGSLIARDRSIYDDSDDLIYLRTAPVKSHYTTGTANGMLRIAPGLPITHLSQLDVPKPSVNRLFQSAASSEAVLPPIGTPRSTRAVSSASTSSVALSQSRMGSIYGSGPLGKLEHGLEVRTALLAKAPPAAFAPIGTRADGSSISSPTRTGGSIIPSAFHEQSMAVRRGDQNAQDRKAESTSVDDSGKQETTYASAAKGPGNMNVAGTPNAKLEPARAPTPTSPAQLEQRHMNYLLPIPDVETPAQQLRMVLIYGLNSNTKLANITALIGHDVGAVKGITLADDSNTPSTRTAVVTFHHASFAEFFMAKQTAKADSKIEVKLGNPVPADTELRRMDVPESVRRRLTITGKSLFHGANPEQAIRAFLLPYVKDSAFDTVFVHNAGNATTVFATVGHALIAHEILNKIGMQNGHKYFGMKATFSKDPCEHLMRLIKSPPHPNPGVGASGHGAGRGGGGTSRWRNPTAAPMMRRRVRGS